MEPKSVLDKLDMEGVVTFELTSEKKYLVVEENCDRCFSVILTREGVYQLIDELGILAAQMVQEIDPDAYTTPEGYD
jgi:hypothetical protein